MNKCIVLKLKKPLLHTMCVLLISLSLTGCVKSTSKEAGIVCHVIMMCKYLIFEPSDFTYLYENGFCYLEGIEDWEKLAYFDAEEKLLILEEEMKEKGAVYPEDMAFLYETIGCLYIDMAKYEEAYDYLIDAYVTMQEVYGEDVYYQNTVALALCHYYYAIGDYDRCLIEVQNLRDNNVNNNTITKASVDINAFLQVILNNISAQVSYGRGEFANAINLYDKSMNMCQDAIDNQNVDATFMTAMKIYILENMGDTAYNLGEDYWETSIKFYDIALKTLDNYYVGEEANKTKAEILVKKAYNMANFRVKRNVAFKFIHEAMKIQKNLYENAKAYPGLVVTYRTYGDMLGFLKYDLDGAQYYYDKALTLSIASYGKNHPETAKVYECLGRFHGNRTEDIDQSIEYYKQGLEICRNLMIEDSSLAADIDLGLAGVYKFKGDDTMSDEYLDKALSIYEKLGMHLVTTDKGEDSIEDGE